MHSTHDRIRGVSLRELLPKAKFLGGPDIRVTSVCSDAARCRPGDLYVALLTSEDDGHDHVHKAIRRGATAVLCERLVAASVPMCFVPNTHSALGRVCQDQQRLLDNIALFVEYCCFHYDGRRPTCHELPRP